LPATSTTIPATTATSTRTTTLKPSRRSTPGVAPWLIAAALVWTLFAFGGAYWWTLPPAAAAIAAAAFAIRPRVAGAGSRLLDAALLACLLCPLLQLIPLPGAWRRTLSPHAPLVDLLLRFGGDAARARPLTLDEAGSVKAAAVAAMVVVLFWTVREALGYGGVRRLARAVAWSGLVVSVIAVIVRASRTTLVYGVWDSGYATEPYGPFINRNHMGTWLVMALPLVIGYVFARADRLGRERSPAAGIDTAMVWLVGAACAMFAAAIVSLSRSTAVGIAAAGVFGAALVVKRRGVATRWMLAGAVLSAAIVLSIPKTVELADRFQDSKTTATWDRPQIWRETLPIVRDFALTGTGLGSFATAMLVYQRSDRTLFFNQAHNQYLQLAAEGGVLLLLPLSLAAAAFVVTVRRGLATDRSSMFWLRVGATAGIVGVLTQGVWETGLCIPANGLLFAALCAVAAHQHRR
jgi:O-antigen ligase